MERLEERDLRGEVVDGRFRVEDRLGSGGMGTVWRVQHVVSLQRFALKTLDPAYAQQEEATQRFLREARSAGALKTRHVVRIIDAQMHHRHQDAPLPFLVMELLEGQNLQQILDARGRLTPAELVWLAGQLGRALDAAHRQGIVHRDLKPSNVFIAADDDGQPIVKLCDFGIAKLTGDAAALGTDTSMPTRTGALLGTPMYLAPELLRGAGAAVPATDQWSMGLIGFRALASVEYFAHVRGFSDLVLTIANDPLVAPSQRASGLPRAFDGWFLRSCARRPEDRFADVPAQVAALEQALGRPAPAPIAAQGATAPAVPIGTAATAAEPAGPARAAAPPRSPRALRRKLVLAGACLWAVGAIAALGWLGARKQPEVHATVTAGPVAPAVAATAPAAAENAAPERAPASDTSARSDTGAPATPHAAVPAEGIADSVSNAPAPPPHATESLSAAAHHHHKTATHPVPLPPARVEARSAGLLPKGAPCHRSSECASGLCAAESCI
jgi:tRNA A-37 threonylcarbamoyl transferase component Bud32